MLYCEEKFLYSLNRVVLIIISAIMSFIFYYRAGGSNFSFNSCWYNGSWLDLKRIELWDNRKEVFSSVFIAVSIIYCITVWEISQYVSTGK